MQLPQLKNQKAGKVTILLQSGEEADLEELMPLVYQELRVLAAALFKRERSNHTLQPTALVHEAYFRLVGQRENVAWQNRAHFFGIAAHLMRQILVNHALARKAEKRGGSKTFITFDENRDFSHFRNIEILDLHEALDKLAELDEQQSKIVELRFFGGLTLEETAEFLQISVMKVRREWQTAKMWLYKMLDKN